MDYQNMKYQREFISKYNDETREKFNDFYFSKSDDMIIEDLKKMILSCQRDKYFTIKVKSFETIDDYDTITKILYNSHGEKNMVYLNDSDLRILKINYYIAYGDDSKDLEVYIAIPRVFEGSYMMLNGNMYIPLYQLVDGSTYNNTTAKNSKSETITLRSLCTSSAKMIRNFYMLKTSDGTQVEAASYSVNLFQRKVPVMNYFLARFGFFGALDLFGFTNLVTIERIETSKAFKDIPDTYAFITKGHKGSYYVIYCSKFFFDNERVFQSLIFCLIESLKKMTYVQYDDGMYSINFWKSALGFYFVNKPEQMLDMGNSILYSLESMYDITTKEKLRLPEEDKANIYLILKWMATEFTKLRLKSNTNVVNKRIRWSEWIASLYIAKINTGLFRISEINKKNNRKDNLKKIEQAINIRPMFLLSCIMKNSLKGFVNMVNERDSMLMLKYTIKGPSGPGDKNSKNISTTLRRIDPTQIGIIDINSSSASDPGVVGMLCPLNRKIYDGKFTEEMEPNEWQGTFDSMKASFIEEKKIKPAFIITKGTDHNGNST